MKKILVVYNPNAGRGKSASQVHRLVKLLRDKRFEVETRVSGLSGDHWHRLLSTERDTSALVVAGGDGTINNVLNSLPDPSRIPIAVVPMGTANILAFELGLPRKPEAVVRAIEQGNIRRIDMGLAGSRRFLSVLGAGFDGMVARELSKSAWSPIGYRRYVFPILRAMARYREPELKITVDGQKELAGSLAIVSNIRNYARILSFTDRARCDSGHFDMCVFSKAAIWDLYRYGFAALFKSVSRDGGCLYVTGRSIRIESSAPVAVQVDGDYLGTSPVDIDILPASIPIIVPQNGPGDSR